MNRFGLGRKIGLRVACVLVWGGVVAAVIPARADIFSSTCTPVTWTTPTDPEWVKELCLLKRPEDIAAWSSDRANCQGEDASRFLNEELQYKVTYLRGAVESGSEKAELYRSALSAWERLSPSHAGAILLYVGSAYRHVNSALWAGGQPAQCIQPLTDLLTEALEKLPRFEGVVWRGLSLNAAARALYIPGATVSWPAYSSSTTDYDVAAEFADDSKHPENSVIFKIHSKSCRDLRVLNPLESEILCLPGIKLRVVGREEPNLIVLQEL